LFTDEAVEAMDRSNTDAAVIPIALALKDERRRVHNL
jgi:hypothetical protein